MPALRLCGCRWRTGRLGAGLLTMLSLALTACDRNEQVAEEAVANAPAARYVGGLVCAQCHLDEFNDWQASHHRHAMQAASEDAVLGDFDGAEFAYNGVTTRFFRRGSEFRISTDDAAGELAEFPVRFAFGIEPLQQYLLEMPDGRLQALSIAWDTRPVGDGGQRWFHLYPDDAIDGGDALHWTGIYHNWNASCAECHSTNLIKAYDPDADRFDTVFSEAEVSCEACHGPGSLHAESPVAHRLPLAAAARAWVFEGGDAIAHRLPELQTGEEVEVCAQCHSRRAQLHDRYEPGDSFLDAHIPERLNVGLYHADGQILDEVYVYGSFLQSRMHSGGVVCSDCHDPHSGALRVSGNGLCSQCHLPAEFDTPGHHRHASGSAGADCLNCHMPERNYMIVDGRRDHSFRVPRPDLTMTLGVPNACNQCHADRTPEWAAENAAAWYPRGRAGRPHYGEALDAGRTWRADRRSRLLELIENDEDPSIVRATALRALSQQFEDADFDLLSRLLRGDEPLLRLAALESLGNAPIDVRVDLGQRFLADPAAALRIAAASALIPARDRLGPGRRVEFEAALNEYMDAQRFNGERAESWLNLGSVRAALGEFTAAESDYRAAIVRQPGFAPAYVNLADLYRGLGRDREAEQVLREGLRHRPDDAALLHGLGLSLVRLGRSGEALPALEAASEHGADLPRYRYVYGVALHSSGDAAAALEVLDASHRRFPGYAPTLIALATMSRDLERIEQARVYTRRLLEISPAAAETRALAAELGVAP